MIIHSPLRRRHTWPFELFEFLCEESTDPHLPQNGAEHDHSHQNQNGVNIFSTWSSDNGNGNGINNHHINNRDLPDPSFCHPNQHQHQHLFQFEYELNDIDKSERTLLQNHKVEGCCSKNRKSKDSDVHVCTCRTKCGSTTSNSNTKNKIGLLDATTVLCASVLSNASGVGVPVGKLGNNNTSDLDGDSASANSNNRQNQNQQTFTFPGESTNSNSNSNGSGAEAEILAPGCDGKSTKKHPGGFQPIQDKFSFLSKKSRDSRKKRQKERDKDKLISSTTPTIIKHKDYCPHSKLQEVKSSSTNTNVTISPTRKSNSSSVFNKSGDRDLFTSTSSNNNSPSHSQHSSSHASQGVISSVSLPSSQIQGILNQKNGIGSSIGSGGSGSGCNSGKGSVTVVTANIINCNSHHETEGKIPSANGTATGALSLQVNTANGEVKKTITLWQNYYPEGQWGWIVVFCALIVQAINHGMQMGVSTFLVRVERRFQVKEEAWMGLLASTSIGISLFLSPVWVSFCKTKSTRLSGVFGGLVASLGCLFTSFASQFHQLFFSYGAFIGVGVGLSRDASSLMVGQYFKRKREMVEIIVVAGSGLGIALMSTSIHVAITSIGWILGLQAVTGAVLMTFFLGTCFRSASLYHPQRRAILHLKNQKKKVKDISKREEKPPFLDFSCLKSKTLQILLLSSAFISFGINSPLIYLGLECREAKVDEISFVLLHVYVGLGWVLGCCLFGLVAIQKNHECRVSKQYLCQVASVICGISIISFTAVKGYSGYVIFAWVYGFFLGGYNYALKVYTYERVRARHFPRAWSFVQSSQAIPIFISTPLISLMNQYLGIGRKSGYYMSAIAVFMGSAFLFLTDVRRRRLSRRKANNSSMKTCSTSDATQTPKMRRLSFAFPVEPISPHHPSKPDSGDGQGSVLDPVIMSKELTCISEEGLAEIDFQDIYFDDWAEYLGGDCITSCNKVENCLASEYDPDFSLLLDRRTRRWSRNSIPFPGMGTSGAGGVTNISSHSHLLPNNSDSFGETLRVPHPQPSLREIPVFRNYPWSTRAPTTQRSITVIDEASV